MATEARAYLRHLDENRLNSACPADIKAWLIALGNTTAGGAVTPDEARKRVGALVAVLNDYPSGAFTDETLKRAVRAFKFFPSGQELSAFLDAIVAGLRERRRRLVVLTTPTPKRDGGNGGGPVQQQGPRTLAPDVQAALDRALGRSFPDTQNQQEARA